MQSCWRDSSENMPECKRRGDGFQCQSCGASPLRTPGTELHVDHILPWSSGGEAVDSNLQSKRPRAVHIATRRVRRLHTSSRGAGPFRGGCDSARGWCHHVPRPGHRGVRVRPAAVCVWESVHHVRVRQKPSAIAQCSRHPRSSSPACLAAHRRRPCLT